MHWMRLLLVLSVIIACWILAFSLPDKIIITEHYDLEMNMLSENTEQIGSVFERVVIAVALSVLLGGVAYCVGHVFHKAACRIIHVEYE